VLDAFLFFVFTLGYFDLNWAPCSQLTFTQL
jgi:hypothetical protein